MDPDAKKTVARNEAGRSVIVCFILGYRVVRLGHQLIASGVKGDFKFFGGSGRR